VTQALTRRRGVAVLVAGGLLALAAPDASAAPRAAASVPVAVSTSVATATAAPSYTSAQVRMRAALNARVRNPVLGTRITGHVFDGTTGASVWGRGWEYGRMPASTTKLATAVTALQVMGPDRVLTTRVRKGARTSTRQVVYLVGAADPALSSAQVDRLAARTLAALGPLGGRKLTVAVDDSLFPAPRLARGWPSSYYPHDVAPVRALIVDQREVMDTSLDAGRIFAAKLVARGAGVAGVVRARTVSGAAVLATHTSPPVRTLVATMLNKSDNDYAEGLLRLSAIARGHTATWTNSNAVARSVLRDLRVPLTGVVLYDGSGLSRSNRMTARSLTAILRAAASPGRPRLHSVYAPTALPIAGMTGTLRAARGRFTTAPSNCARGRLVAKTGTLRDVVTLAGRTTGADGRQHFFAFMVNGPSSTLTVKRAVDGLAATVTGCW
jgi:D-alanyl-D-alanine carboxypeptidase/D-alanyl-D-alanine-endopeptidase (penicillin-binding protein 4)